MAWKQRFPRRLQLTLRVPRTQGFGQFLLEIPENKVRIDLKKGGFLESHGKGFTFTFALRNHPDPLNWEDLDDIQSQVMRNGAEEGNLRRDKK